MAVTQPAPSAPWLVMVYLAGDNNLSTEMVLALQELLAGASPAGDVIVAQFDPSGMGITTQRYNFTPKPGATTLEEYRDATFDATETDTGCPETLQEFILWADSMDPEHNMHRMLILSGHGSGVTEDFLLQDDNAADSLSIPELTGVLAKVTENGKRKIDILGLDACFMSMGEIAHELRNYVKFLIGSEGVDPAFGWPYRRILAGVRAARASVGASLSPADLAELIVTTYVEYYADYDGSAGRSADLAALNLSNIERVTTAFRDLVQTLANVVFADPDKLLAAHYRAQTYKYDQFVDLKDLSAQIATKIRDEAVVTACDALQNAVKAAVTLSGCTGCAYQHSHGMSVYFPWAFVAPEYANLEFAQLTGWFEFLQNYVRVTQRDCRSGFKTVQFPTAGKGANVATVIDDRKKTLTRLLQQALQPGATIGAASAVGVTVTAPPYEQQILQRIRALNAAAVARNAPALLGRVIDTVAAADVPANEVSSEIVRRFLRASGRYTGVGSKYTIEHSKYTGEGSRSVVDRQECVKNLAPAIGKAYDR